MQVLIGQPFDLVKVRIQAAASAGNGAAAPTPLTVFRQTLAHEGPLAFYKGTLAPLVGVGACVSVQFYAFHDAKRLLQQRNADSGIVPGTALGLTYPQIYLAGAAAGIANTPLTSPIEQVRILLQTQRAPAAAAAAGKVRWHGPRDVVRDLLAHGGVSSGLYRGFGITLLREAQAYGVWFATYEYLIASFVAHLQTSATPGAVLTRNDLPTPYLLLAGALAGEALWLASYPLDVLKSRVQADSVLAAESKYKGSALRAARDVWATQGAYGFWRGIAPTLLRAIPASSGTFAAVELTLRVLG